MHLGGCGSEKEEGDTELQARKEVRVSEREWNREEGEEREREK